VLTFHICWILIDEIIHGWPEDGFLEVESCSHARVSKLNYLSCVLTDTFVILLDYLKLILSAIHILQTKLSSHCPFSGRFGMLILCHYGA
jgi:hypothetical protein